MRLYTLLIAIMLCMSASAQGTATAPETLTEGTRTVAIDEAGFRQVLYYSYTAPRDCLLSLTLPTSSAAVVASYTGGDPYQSEFPTYCVGNDETASTSFACFAPKDKTIYLKVTLLVLAFPQGTTSAEITVATQPYDINNGQDQANPIQTHDGSTVFLPLEVDSEAPYLPLATYTAYTVEHDGWLYLNFTPSVTSIYYRHPDEETFSYLKGEYIVENGKTVGTKAFMEVTKGESLLFEIKGFNGTMLTTTLENPDPGTSCDFPLPIEQPGLIAIPDGPGDWYWIFTPAKEGYVELTSDINLEGGHIEVMMDCNHTGSFTIYDSFRLRAWVYDRMEYLIHLKKETATEGAQFMMQLSEPLPCDDSFTAPDMESGAEYVTPAFAGTYYYRIAAAPDKARDLELHTMGSDLDSRTRVNLYEENDLTETLARGLDLTYALSPGKAYIMKWTVFNIEKAIPFSITLTDKSSSVGDIENKEEKITVNGTFVTLNANGEKAEIYSTDGRNIFSAHLKETTRTTLEPGIYVVKIGAHSEKIIIR